MVKQTAKLVYGPRLSNISALARELGCSRTTVREVWKGRRKSARIYEELASRGLRPRAYRG